MVQFQGIYKDFFNEQNEDVVRNWYINEASPDERFAVKNIIKEIINFDEDSHMKSVRKGHDPDIFTGNAIFSQYHGDELISVENKEKTIAWLTFAPQARQQEFRNIFMAITKPKKFYYKKNKDDYFFDKQKISDKLTGKNLFHNMSEGRNLESDLVGVHPTTTGRFFYWRTAPLGSASAVYRKAHEGTFRDVPWGKYSMGSKGDRQLLSSVATVDYSDKFFLQNQKKRHFQNYNDNYIALLTDVYLKN